MKTVEENEKIFSIFKKINKNPKTALFYKTEFELLICVILSAKSKDVMVNQITKNLFDKADTPEKMIDATHCFCMFCLRSFS